MERCTHTARVSRVNGVNLDDVATNMVNLMRLAERTILLQEEELRDDKFVEEERNMHVTFQPAKYKVSNRIIYLHNICYNP